MSVSNEFKNITKKIKQQNIKLSICDGELTVKEVHMMPVHIFNALPVWKLRKQKETIAKELKYSFNGQLFKTIMKQVEITVKNANEIKDKDINFQYGLFINNKFEYVDLGNYFIKDVEDSKKKDEITVTGYDRMIRFMKTFKQSELQLKYPCKMLKLVQKMCEVCGVELYSTDFYNADLDVEEDFFTAQELTYRDVLEKIAQATLTTAFIEDNKLNLYKVSDDTIEKIDKSYLTDLTIKEKFGPVNVLVLGRGDVEDNIEETDKKSIEQNGRYEIRFDENEFIEFQREQVIKGMFEQIKGLEYYAFEASDVGVMWLKPCSCIQLGDKENNFYKSYYLKANITINTGISSDIEAGLPETTDTEYKVTTKEEKKTLKVERLAKKNEGLIQDLVQKNSEQSQKLSKVEQTVDSITQKVSDIEDLTQTAKGVKTVTLDNCIEGNLLELHIYGNNTVFDYITLSDNLVLSDDLHPKGDSLITVTDKDGKKTEYELNISEPLRQNGDAYDEYILKYGKAQVIRRINADGTIKSTAITEEIKAAEILLKEGKNILTIKNYTASLSAKYAIKSLYSETFATNVKMDSEIKQTAQSIDLSVNKKLESYSTTDEMNSAIKLKTDSIATEVSKKVGKTEVGTYIEQNVDAIKYAWNQISEFIQMMIINNNASFAILDQNKKVLMALDKTGQHFYKSDGTTIFGEMGVNKEDSNSYISFAVDGEYNKDISDGMAWGIKTKSDNKYYPILFIKNFHMGAKDSDDVYGQLVLKYCDLILEGMETGIQSGNVRFYGNVFSGITFEDTNSGSGLLNIYPANSMISGAENGGLAILDNITLFKNASGSNSFKISSGNNNYVILTDNGDITALGGNVILGNNNNKIGFSVTANTAYFWGDVNVNGNIYANNLSSDVRIKENIKDSTDSALDIINKIQHKEFDKKDDGRHYKIGYIAQEMEKIDPNFVIKRPEDKEKNIEERYYINELPIIATLTKAIQEQQKQIEELKNKINKLEEVNNE